MPRSLFSAELRAQLRLAAPLCVGQFGLQLMGLVDCAMLGHYSEAALAGSGVAATLLTAITVVGMGTVMGLDSLIPQALGAGEAGRAQKLLRHGFVVAVIFGLPLTAAAAAAPLLLPLAGVDRQVVAQAMLYTLGRLPAILPFLAFTALRSYLQAHGITRPIVVATVVGNLVNAAADVVLIFGLPAIGLPALGALGAALATTVVIVVVTAIALAAARAVSAPRVASRRDRAMTLRIIRVGLPVGLQLLAEVGLFALTSTLAGRLGKIPAAAHQIALALASFAFSAALGIGAATSVRVGRAVGAGDVAGTRRAGLAGFVTVIAFMSTSAAVFVLFSHQLAGLMTGDRAVATAAAPLIAIAALFQLSDGVQAVAGGALRGAGDTRSTFYGHVFGLYAVGAPVAIALAFRAHLGAPGLWWGLFAGLTTVALALSARFAWLSARPITRA